MKISLSRTKAVYEKSTRDFLFYNFNLERVRTTVKLFENETCLKGKEILDIGGGVGLLSLFLSKKKAEVTLMDKNRWMLKIAKSLFLENKAKVKVEKKDVLRLKSSVKFDVVVCNDVIEHVEDKTRFIENIKKLIKKGGILFIKTGNKHTMSQILYEDHVNGPMFFLCADRLRRTTYFKTHLISKEGLIRLLKSQDFEVKDLTAKYISLLHLADLEKYYDDSLKRFGIKMFLFLYRYKMFRPILLAQFPQIYIMAKLGA